MRGGVDVPVLLSQGMHQDYHSTRSGVGCAPPWQVRCHPVPPPPTHTHRVGAPSSKGPSKVNASVLAAFPSYPTLDTLKTPQLIRPPQV